MLNQIIGKNIKSATSSLSTFALELDDEIGLLAYAVNNEEGANVSIKIVPANSLPKSQDAVCRVDWAWIVNSKIIDITPRNGSLKLHLDPAGPLIISAGIWQSNPFLSFQPFRSPK